MSNADQVGGASSMTVFADLVLLALMGADAGFVSWVDREAARRIAACAVRMAPDYMSKDLNGAAGVHVWLGKGDVPNTSGGMSGPNVRNVFLSRRGSKTAYLLFVDVRDGADAGVEVDAMSAYELRRSKKSWVTTEGNGGAATYSAIAAYFAIGDFVQFDFEQIGPVVGGCSRD
jgi:hypothetical protein